MRRRRTRLGRLGLAGAAVTVLALVFPAPPTRAGELYYYVDKDGVYHFSDQRKSPQYNKVMMWQNGDYEAATYTLDPQYKEIVTTACKTYAVDENLVLAMMRVESNFNSEAISRKGAQGLMQLMPETARRYRVNDSFNPRDNIYAGVLHLKALLLKYQGNEKLALAAYNAGSGAVDKFQGIPPYPETQTYVKLVLKFRDQYREEATNSAPETQPPASAAHD
jgi:soluble lytic murein transglycosylase